MKNSVIKILVLVLCVVILAGCTFAGTHSTFTAGTPGFLMGVWHGTVAPYTLIVRFFIDIKMYAIPNSGFTYDLGFLLGLVGSIPLGWLTTLVSIAFFLLA